MSGPNTVEGSLRIIDEKLDRSHRSYIQDVEFDKQNTSLKEYFDKSSWNDTERGKFHRLLSKLGYLDSGLSPGEVGNFNTQYMDILDKLKTSFARVDKAIKAETAAKVIEAERMAQEAASEVSKPFVSPQDQARMESEAARVKVANQTRSNLGSGTFTGGNALKLNARRTTASSSSQSASGQPNTLTALFKAPRASAAVTSNVGKGVNITEEEAQNKSRLLQGTAASQSKIKSIAGAGGSVATSTTKSSFGVATAAQIKSKQDARDEEERVTNREYTTQSASSLSKSSVTRTGQQTANSVNRLYSTSAGSSAQNAIAGIAKKERLEEEATSTSNAAVEEYVSSRNDQATHSVNKIIEGVQAERTQAEYLKQHPVLLEEVRVEKKPPIDINEQLAALRLKAEKEKVERDATLQKVRLGEEEVVPGQTFSADTVQTFKGIDENRVAKAESGFTPGKLSAVAIERGQILQQQAAIAQDQETANNKEVLKKVLTYLQGSDESKITLQVLQEKLAKARALVLEMNAAFFDSSENIVQKLQEIALHHHHNVKENIADFNQLKQTMLPVLNGWLRGLDALSGTPGKKDESLMALRALLQTLTARHVENWTTEQLQQLQTLCTSDYSADALALNAVLTKDGTIKSQVKHYVVQWQNSLERMQGEERRLSAEIRTLQANTAQAIKAAQQQKAAGSKPSFVPKLKIPTTSTPFKPLNIVTPVTTPVSVNNNESHSSSHFPNLSTKKDLAETKDLEIVDPELNLNPTEQAFVVLLQEEQQQAEAIDLDDRKKDEPEEAEAVETIVVPQAVQTEVFGEASTLLKKYKQQNFIPADGTEIEKLRAAIQQLTAYIAHLNEDDTALVAEWKKVRDEQVREPSQEEKELLIQELRRACSVLSVKLAILERPQLFRRASLLNSVPQVSQVNVSGTTVTPRKAPIAPPLQPSSSTQQPNIAKVVMQESPLFNPNSSSVSSTSINPTEYNAAEGFVDVDTDKTSSTIPVVPTVNRKPLKPWTQSTIDFTTGNETGIRDSNDFSEYFQDLDNGSDSWSLEHKDDDEEEDLGELEEDEKDLVSLTSALKPPILAVDNLLTPEVDFTSRAASGSSTDEPPELIDVVSETASNVDDDDDSAEDNMSVVSSLTDNTAEREQRTIAYLCACVRPIWDRLPTYTDVAEHITAEAIVEGGLMAGGVVLSGGAFALMIAATFVTVGTIHLCLNARAAEQERKARIEQCESLDDVKRKITSNDLSDLSDALNKLDVSTDKLDSYKSYLGSFKQAIKSFMPNVKSWANMSKDQLLEAWLSKQKGDSAIEIHPTLHELSTSLEAQWSPEVVGLAKKLETPVNAWLEAIKKDQAYIQQAEGIIADVRKKIDEYVDEKVGDGTFDAQDDEYKKLTKAWDDRNSELMTLKAAWEKKFGTLVDLNGEKDVLSKYEKISSAVSTKPTLATLLQKISVQIQMAKDYSGKLILASETSERKTMSMDDWKKIKPAAGAVVSMIAGGGTGSTNVATKGTYVEAPEAKEVLVEVAQCGIKEVYAYANESHTSEANGKMLVTGKCLVTQHELDSNQDIKRAFAEGVLNMAAEALESSINKNSHSWKAGKYIANGRPSTIYIYSNNIQEAKFTRAALLCLGVHADSIVTIPKLYSLDPVYFDAKQKNKALRGQIDYAKTADVKELLDALMTPKDSAADTKKAYQQPKDFETMSAAIQRVHRYAEATQQVAKVSWKVPNDEARKKALILPDDLKVRVDRNAPRGVGKGLSG